jgi:SAM-dependent methyltransferase
MRWRNGGIVAACTAVLACSPPPPAVRVVVPSPAPPPPAAAPWPDVAREARTEKSGAHDVAVVVAVERREALPKLAGVRVSGEDWVRFFPNVLGVPPERVTALFDAGATRAAIASALREAAARLRPGGRLWFVAIGYAAINETDVVAAATVPGAQLVSVLDVVPETTGASATSGTVPTPEAIPPITFSIASPTQLPGASRPALAYLLMGALRGWADRDHDRRVTAAEAADYVDLTLRLLSPPRAAERRRSVHTELVCSNLTTLSVALEAAPNIQQIAPRVPLGPHADPERLAIAMEAVRRADSQVARAELQEPRAIPAEVESRLRVRLEQAERLGGASVPEAAALLVEAGRLSLAHGRLDETQRILMPVVQARCGADASGHRAWEILLGVVGRTEAREDGERLVSMDCAYDEASAEAIDTLRRVVRSPDGPEERASQLYSIAEQETDVTLARCAWSAAAEGFAKSWWSAPAAFSQVGSALNGAYALRKLGRSEEAAALYHAYVKRHGGATAGDSASRAKERRAFAFVACRSYLALAKTESRLFPGYFDACQDVRCDGIDPATCTELGVNAEVSQLDFVAGEPEHARQLSLAARDREELAGWETTEAARAERLREASAKYAAAEAAWAAIVNRGDAIPRPAEAARRLAEAAVRRVCVELDAGAEVDPPSVERARQLARRARDASTDERRVEPARLLVELADAVLAREHRVFRASGGERGVAPRFEVRFEGEGEGRHFVWDAIPEQVAAAIDARAEYLDHVPATFDAGQSRYRMAYEAGRLQFLYGHFDTARPQLELPYSMACGVGPVAHEAWVLLLLLANFEGDVPRAMSLAADAAVCPSDVETRIDADRRRKPVRSIPFVLEGRRQLQASEALPEGAERRKLRREAAAIFRHFVLEAEARDEAPEAARLAAELYTVLEEHSRALDMYRFFLDHYGKDARVRPADLEKAYAALASLHARLGDHRARARVLFEQSEEQRLPAKARAAAARKARELRKDRDGRGL